MKETGLGKKGRKCESETKILFYIVILNVGSFLSLCVKEKFNFYIFILI